jgi:DNA invertase Pin-like site-specific DNA recombinase
MKTVIYTRVSTDEQRKQGFSLQEQERSLRAFAERMGMEVIAHYQDDYSAKDFNRPQFKRFLQDVETKRIRPQILLCVRIDRFSRNLQDSLEMITRLKKYGVELRFVDRDYNTGNPEDLIMKVIDMAMAEVYNARLSINTTKGMREAMRAGRWMGRAPVGYRNDKESKSVLFDPVSSVFVIRAFEMMETGMYYAEEVRIFIRDEYGYYFTKQKFLNLLRNRFYCGIIEIKPWRNEPGFSLKGVHEPMVSEELFNRVQWVMNNRKKSKGQSDLRREEFPLRSLLVCPRCGRHLTGSASKSRNGSLHHYYHCQKKYNCDFRVRAAIAHDRLEEFFGSFRIQPEVKKLYRLILEKKFSQMNSGKETDLKKIKVDMSGVTAKLKSLNEKFIADHIDVETYSAMKKKLDEEIVDLKNREAQILEQESDFALYIKQGFTLVDNLRRFYHDASVEVKQKIVGSIFPQKLVFDQNSYRTSPVNVAFLQITRVIEQIQKQNATVSDGVFELAPPPGLEPGTL